MSKASLKPVARLRCQLSTRTLMGVAAGENVHCMVQCPSDPSAQGAGSTIERGVYQIQPPVEDPLRGRIAILTHLEEPSTSGAIGGRSLVGSGIARSVGHTHLLSQAVMHHPPAVSTASPASLILAGGPLGGSNVLVVTTGFDELVDLLEETGGGTLEVLP